jgi:HK97 family phage prohead protease
MSTQLELRDEADGLTLSGHASVVEAPYEMNGYTETIKRGAFKRSLNDDSLDVVLLVNHEGLPLARTTSGNLHLSEDSIGLRMRASLDASDPEVQAVARKMRRGDLNELSFAFQIASQTWSADYTERTIETVNLQRGDVAIVARAANPAATATLRQKDAELTLNQRRNRAEMLGKRMTGAPLQISRTGSGECARCGGEGAITIRCPNCGGDDGEQEEGVGVYGRGAASSDFLVFARNRATELRAGRVIRTGDAVEDAKHALAAHRALDTGKERDRMRAREHEIEIQRERDRDARRSRERRMREAGWR